jgi:hypothetical protein
MRCHGNSFHLLVTTGMPSTSRCLPTDVCRISLMWEVSTPPTLGVLGSVVVLRDTLTDLVSFACQHQEYQFVFSAVMGTTNRLLSLVRHARPHTKRLVQQFLSCGFSKRNVPPGQYKQCATPPRRRYELSWATPWQETYLAQTHFPKTETTRKHPHQNVLVTRTWVRTLCKQQTSHI